MATIAQNNERIYVLRENIRYWETMKERGFAGSVVGLLLIMEDEIAKLESDNADKYHEIYGK